jgi:hypothetical protein
MRRYHNIDGIRTSKAGGKKVKVFDRSDSRSCAGGDNGCASFGIGADNGNLMACGDQPADQRAVDIAKGSEKYIIHDCKFKGKTIPLLSF